MSSDLLLSARGVSKIYSGTTKPLATLRRALFGGKLPKGDEYPVLHDIDLDICRGETVGIMGRNGAGKTTLLGILGGVIQSTSGSVERHARLATLLGLTTGFNQNFTGRENAYLFCSLQHFTREQAKDRIAAIEEFSELGKYFDLPIRVYSSGMQSRLAFSCAVHVDAEVIIIDETLAVGDANFRMKCYERIGEMKRQGQTFLLVSHNQNTVANFCTRGIVLEGGHKVFDGDTFAAVEEYKRIRTEALGDSDFRTTVQKSASALPQSVRLDDIQLQECMIDGVPHGVIRADLKADKPMRNVTLNFGISSSNGVVICAWNGEQAGFILPQLQAGETYPVELTFAKHLLPGRYFISLIVHELIGDVARPQSLYQNRLAFDIAGQSPMSGVADLNMQAIFVDLNKDQSRAG